MEYRKAKAVKKASAKQPALWPLPSIFTDEPLESIHYRRDRFWEVMRTFDAASQEYLNGVIDSFRADLAEALAAACQPSHSLNSTSKWLDLPRIMHINGSSITSGFAYGGLLLAQDTLVVDCTPSTSFSDVIRSLASFLGLPQAELSEYFIDVVRDALEMRDVLVLAFHNSDHLPARTLKTLLDYFKMANGSGKIVFACDGLSCVDRLDARTKYSLHVSNVSAPAVQDLLVNLVIFLTKCLGNHMVLSADVVLWLQGQCLDAGLPLTSQIHAIKYCLYAHLCQDVFSYLPNLAHFSETSKDRLRKTLKWQHPSISKVYSDPANPNFSADPFVLAADSAETLPEKLGTNIAVFSILLVIFECVQWEGKSKTEIYQLMLESNFGHHIFFDMIPSKVQAHLKGGRIEEYVGLLQRVAHVLEALDLDSKFGERLLIRIQGDVESIKRAADVSRSIEGLVNELRNADYLNRNAIGAEQVLFSDHRQLAKALFPDTAQAIQRVLKMRPAGVASLHASLPDTSIVYSLTLDWQRIVNTKDLYHQFLGVVAPAGKKKAKDAEQQRPLMLRFMQALNELELLGLLASSGRRRDHYERLNLSDANTECNS